MASHSQRVAGQREIDSVQTLKPFIHIVRPLKKHHASGGDPMPGERPQIMVQMPVQLHVFDDAPDFERRIQPELLRLVKSLHDEGAAKIHIHYDGIAARNRAMVEALGSQMGFYKNTYEGKKVLAFDPRRFKAYLGSER